MPSTDKHESSLLVTKDGNRWHYSIIPTEYSKIRHTPRKIPTSNEYFETNNSYLKRKRNVRKKTELF